jgi:hypothetical protein
MKHITHYLYPEKYATIPYQIILCIIAVSTFIFLTHKPVAEFRPVGPSPRVHQLTPNVIKQWGKEPARVKVGMHIADFLRFDTVKNDFILNAFIWFSFDPNKVTAETIDKFAFTKGDLIFKSDPIVKKVGAITVMSYIIRLQFSTILDYARFPLDDHSLFLNLTNLAVPADELIYQADDKDYIISPTIYISGWKIDKHTVKSGYTTIELGSNTTLLQQKTVFSLDISKEDVRQLVLILFPLLLLFYLSLFTFAIRDATIAMTLPIGSLGGLLAYSFVIQTLAPAVGYFMISDYLFLFCLASNFIVFLVGGLITLPEHILSRRTLAKIEGLTVLLLQIAFIAFWYYLTRMSGYLP